MGSGAVQVDVVTRVSVLLRVLAANNRTGLRLVDILKLADIERSTAHRLLQSMITEGLVFQDHESKRYFLGMAIYEMGVAVPAHRLRDICQPYVKSVAQETGDTVFLTVRSGFNGICVDRQEGGMPVAFVQEAGRSRPLIIGAGGLAILSSLDELEASRIRVENASRTTARYPDYTEKEIEARLNAGRQKGYVFADVLEKPEIKALGMCIKDESCHPVAAISLSAFATKWSERRLEAVVELLRNTVQCLEKNIASEAVFRKKA